MSEDHNSDLLKELKEEVDSLQNQLMIRDTQIKELESQIKEEEKNVKTELELFLKLAIFLSIFY